MAPLGPSARRRIAAGVSGGPHSLALACWRTAGPRRGGALLALSSTTGCGPAARRRRPVSPGCWRRAASPRASCRSASPAGRGCRNAPVPPPCRAAGRLPGGRERPGCCSATIAPTRRRPCCSRALRGSGPGGLAAMAAARGRRRRRWCCGPCSAPRRRGWRRWWRRRPGPGAGPEQCRSRFARIALRPPSPIRPAAAPPPRRWPRPPRPSPPAGRGGRRRSRRGWPGGAAVPLGRA